MLQRWDHKTTQNEIVKIDYDLLSFFRLFTHFIVGSILKFSQSGRMAIFSERSENLSLNCRTWRRVMCYYLIISCNFFTLPGATQTHKNAFFRTFSSGRTDLGISCSGISSLWFYAKSSVGFFEIIFSFHSFFYFLIFFR